MVESPSVALVLSLRHGRLKFDGTGIALAAADPAAWLSSA